MPPPDLARLLASRPVILAPLGGDPSTPALAAAVANAGGLGALGAAYLSADRIGPAIRETRQLTTEPFHVNLFAGAWTHPKPNNSAPMLKLLADAHARLNLPPPELPEVPPDPFPSQLEALIAERPAIFSFTFGIPTPAQLSALRHANIATLGTATTAAEAQILAATGIDGIIAQGSEAGGHRGTFASPFPDAMIPTLRLVREIRSAGITHPVIAAGGLMHGRDIADALAAGATAAMLGTAYLACPESGASPAYKQAILVASATTTAPDADPTIITTAFSGRPARGLPNAFTNALRGHEPDILPYPLQNALTRPMRSTAARLGDANYLSLWAGQRVAQARPLPAAELTRQLLSELHAAQAKTAPQA